MAKATHLNEIPQGGTLYTFRLPGGEQVANNRM